MTRKKLLLTLLSGVFMMMSILKVFGMSGSPDTLQLLPRQIQLSGNTFSFKIPEDFSRDMPAQDLIETVDLTDPELTQIPEKSTLLRRWWDIKKPGIFDKDMGTVMMSITVHEKPENQAGILKAKEYDFKNMLHFVVAIYDSLEQRNREHNKEVLVSGDNDLSIYVPSLATQIGETIYSNYKDFSNNEKKWILTGTGIARTGQNNKHYTIPLNNNLFLEIEFSLMPNGNVIAREFVDLAMNRVNAIVETFDLHYAADNEFEKITSVDWINKTVLDVLKSNQDQLLPELK